MQDLTFIGLSGHTAQDTRATNKTVRAHVMRRYKRQKKADLESTDEKSILGGNLGYDAPTESLPRPCCPPSCLDITCTFGSPYQAYQAHDVRSWLDGKLDPFSSLPIHADTRTLMLLQQNTTLPIRTSVHSDPSSHYRNTCSKDPAWLFMHLYYAACRFPHTSGPSFEAAHYLSKSVRAINKSIGSSNLIEDSTIATVACLTNIENLNGKTSDAHIHMQGLIRMVALRGGLSNLGIRGILRRMVLWSDLLTGLSSETAPYFPFTPIDKPFELWQFTPTSRNRYRLTPNQKLASITTIKHRICLTQLLVSLHELSTFLNCVGDGLLPWDASYPDRVYEVEYDIILSLFDDSVISECDATTNIGKLLLHAALLFIYSNLRETPVGGTIRRRLLTRLMAAMDRADLQSSEFVAEILWVLAIGTFAAKGAPQMRFIQEARRICAETGTWAEVTALLKRLPILLDTCVVTCMGLWMDRNN